MPVPLQHIDEEELYAAVADTHGGGRPLINVFAMEKIILQFPLGDFIRGFAEEIDQHTDSAGVVLLSGSAHPGKLQGPH